MADQSLHLFATGKSDKIELLIRAEKIRMTAKNEQGAFRTEFNPKNPCAVWPAFPLTEEEKHRLNEDDPLDEVGQNVGKKRNNQQRAVRWIEGSRRTDEATITNCAKYRVLRQLTGSRSVQSSVMRVAVVWPRTAQNTLFCVSW